MRLDQAALTRWGREIGRLRVSPLFIALHGPLGAGKSTFARAVGVGAGVEGPMPSPTFNVVFSYALPNGSELVHVDLFRVEHPDELWEVGWTDVTASDGLVLVEWAERAAPSLPVPRWEVRLRPVSGDPELREVDVEAVGAPPAIPLPAPT